jgi:spire-like protein
LHLPQQDHEEDEQHFVKPEMLIQSVIETCARHLSVSSEAELHYRNVCRALISEALEFSSFLERTQVPDIFDNELSNLERQEWKQLWDQAMGDLRNGVKLKKTDFTKTPIEFALTPYEMLMDDIR